MVPELSDAAVCLVVRVTSCCLGTVRSVADVNQRQSLPGAVLPVACRGSVSDSGCTVW